MSRKNEVSSKQRRGREQPKGDHPYGSIPIYLPKLGSFCVAVDMFANVNFVENH